MTPPPWIRIATEEAFATTELFDRYRQLLTSGWNGDPGFTSLWSFYLLNASPRITPVIARMTDLDDRRIGDMNDTGIAMQVLSIASPGVQIFDADTAVALARGSNDELAAAIGRHPGRFTGLAAIAPQNPRAAAAELERGVRTLGLKGAIVNSHTRGEYLDDQKFWEIFEAADALRVPIYLHPTTPSPAMLQPFLESGLDGAIFGFAVETGLHMLRLIVSGVFDRFPGLRIVVGHLGEGLPYWLYRLDYMHARMVGAGRYPNVRPLRQKPSDYLREHFYMTTSGMPWEPAILFAQSVIGMDRVLYAMDYPFQFGREEVDVTDNLPISDEDKRKLYQTNAETVFKL